MITGTEPLLHFIATCLIVEATPGPNMGYLLLLSMTHGRRAGFMTVAGIMLGLLTIGLLAALGLATLMQASPLLYATLRWSGVAYLLWLAFEAWRDATATSEPGDISLLTGLRYFRRGLITNLLNPKAVVFYVTVLPEFMPAASASALPHTVLLTVIYVAIATMVHGLIVLCAAQLAPWFAQDRKRAFVQRVFAVLLAGIALWLGFSTRP